MTTDTTKNIMKDTPVACSQKHTKCR